MRWAPRRRRAMLMYKRKERAPNTNTGDAQGTRREGSPRRRILDDEQHGKARLDEAIAE